MLRVRIPGGKLNYEQAKKLGEVAKQYGNDYIDLTTRMQVELRYLKIIDTLYVKKLTKRLSFLTKAAFYKADDGYVTGGAVKGTADVTKFWVQLDYKY